MGWVASLSNGETVFEHENEPGERRAWGQLIDRCEEDGIWVTQIQYQDRGQTFVGIRNADGYCYFIDYRKEGIMSGQMREERRTGIGSVVGNTVHCVLINDQGQSQLDSRPLASMRLHCVLKPA